MEELGTAMGVSPDCGNSERRSEGRAKEAWKDLQRMRRGGESAHRMRGQATDLLGRPKDQLRVATSL